MWRTEKTKEGQDLVWDGVETGIAPSPTKGTANIQNANISTESGEVLAAFARTPEQQAAITNGTLTASVGDGTTLLAAPSTLKAGTWVKVSASTITSITAATNPTTVSVDYLVVAGGGGGGASKDSSQGGGGGGGAGAYKTGSTTFSVGTQAVVVGAGGAGGSIVSGTPSALQGVNGSNSSLGAVATSTGGAGGGGYSSFGASTYVNGLNGGSGGGGAGSTSASAGTGGTGTTGGNNGGAGRTTATASAGGGGGSAAVGGAGVSGAAGTGGAGTSNSITGTATFYAGGGGGGSASGGSGGSNVGGAGGSANANGSAATTNSGGGGGGAANATDVAYSGGSGAAGVVIIAYTTGSMLASGGNITQYGTKTVHTFVSDGTFTVHSINPGGLYYVSYSVGSKVKLSANYDPYGLNPVVHGTSGTATFSTVATIGPAIAKATEKYSTATSTEYRYYVLDNNSYVWVYDTGVFDNNGTLWMLPDPTNYGVFAFTGVNVLNGWLFTISVSSLYGKPTVDLGDYLLSLTNGKLSNPFPTHKNYAFVGNQGKMYYADGNFIGEIFPTTSLLTSLANIQSYGSYTSVTTVGTMTALIGGSLPYTQDGNGTTARIPAVFFTDVYGTQPTNLTTGTIYWIEYGINTGTFSVYAAKTGGSAINIATGAAGNQYFNTFYPNGSDAGINGTNSTLQFTQQRVNFPYNEIVQSITEVGNIVIVGGVSNILYPWNQIDATPSDFIELPESNVKTMINVNNMVYVFAGFNGNVYITNGSVASLALKIPDYCAGVPGTPNSYIEPNFEWFDAMYLRGRVYCSVLDQTATVAGNCGGVWSFVPSQNIDPSQDVGLALRLENQNSYGDYDGTARILITNEEQTTVAPLYWSFWQDSYSIATSVFGVDNTLNTPVTTFVVETDLLATGTLLAKNTFSQVEYKLSAPAVTGDAVQLYWRTNSNGAWTSCGTANIETSDPLAGYYSISFQKTQWIQFRAVCSTGGTTASSFTRLIQLRLR